jgi:mitochondrial distribution and morphology protein 10
MMGHISSAYSAQVSRDLSLASRFDFNVYSYESEWAMGAEWWLRRSSGKAIPSVQGGNNIDVPISENSPQHSDDVHGVIKARASTNKVISPLDCDQLLTNITLGYIHNVGRSIAQYAS